MNEEKNLSALVTQKTTGAISQGPGFNKDRTTRDPITVTSAAKVTIGPDGEIILENPVGLVIGRTIRAAEASTGAVYHEPVTVTARRLTAAPALPPPVKERDRTPYEWTFVVPRRINLLGKQITLPPGVLPELVNHYVVGSETDWAISMELEKVAGSRGKYVLAKKEPVSIY